MIDYGFNTLERTIEHVGVVGLIAGWLVHDNIWFAITPKANDKFIIVVESDNIKMLDRHIKMFKDLKGRVK